jgi:hypothetical protein
LSGCAVFRNDGSACAPFFTFGGGGEGIWPLPVDFFDAALGVGGAFAARENPAENAWQLHGGLSPSCCCSAGKRSTGTQGELVD